MTQDQGRDVHQILRPSRPELETDQALEVHDANSGAPRQRDGDRPIPPNRHQRGQDVEADLADHPSQAGEVAVEPFEGQPLFEQPLARRGQIPDHEVHVSGGAHVSVRPHG
jgi:hypothetical protein